MGGSLGAILACSREQSLERFRARPAAVTHLVSLPGQVSGSPPAEPAALARWLGPELASWSSEDNGSGVRFHSPNLKQLPAQGAHLYLRLQPDGAPRVVITPILEGDVRKLRALRSLEVPLERSSDRRASVELSIDLTEVLTGNWADRPGQRLSKIELWLPGARDAVLEEVAFQSLAARFEQPAGVLLLEHAGVFRPTWYVRGGSRVRIPVAVPQAGAVLRWHESTTSGETDCSVRVIAEAGQSEIARADAPASWRLRSAPLSRFAGQRVALELACAGDGVGLFGDPRIIEAANPNHFNRSNRPLDVIVYLIDPLRPARLGAWGNRGPDVSPVLDELAAEGARFSLALSSSSWTKPAIPTLMTGIAPTTHRVGTRSYADRLPASTPLVQGRFRRAGWRTGSFSASPLGSTLSDLHRDFAAAFPPRHWERRPSAGQLHETFLAWLDEEPDRPFFAYVHTLEVHQWSPQKNPDDFAQALETYDDAVRRADRGLGALLDALEQRDRRDGLLLVVVSDHGESLGREPARHGTALVQPQIHIPLIFWARNALRPREIATPVGLADVTPTLLDLFGLRPIEEAGGESLRSLLEGGRDPVHDFVPASLLRFVWAPLAPQRFSLVAADGRKLIVTSKGDTHRFRLAEDPAEQNAIAEPWPGIESALTRWREDEAKRAAAFRARHGDLSSGVIEAEDASRLRALGYLE